MKYKITFSAGPNANERKAVAYAESAADAKFIEELFYSHAPEGEWDPKQCDFEPVDEPPPKNECTFPLSNPR